MLKRNELTKKSPQTQNQLLLLDEYEHDATQFITNFIIKPRIHLLREPTINILDAEDIIKSTDIKKSCLDSSTNQTENSNYK